MPHQHTKPLHSSGWMLHIEGMMPTSTRQPSKYDGLLPLETPKGIPRSWLLCFLFRIRVGQKLVLEKTSGDCLVPHWSQDTISYPYTASDMFVQPLL